MKYVIGVDPGESKVGLALLDEEGKLIERRLIPRESAAAEIAELCYGRDAVIALGDGTTAGRIALEIKDAFKSGPPPDIAFVDEANSTVEGRWNYLVENRARGLGALLPIGLRTPPRPWDDYVAEIIARRYIKDGAVK